MSDRFRPPPAYDPASMRPSRSCLNCRYLHRDTMGSCDAYPAGIPYDILSGETAHDVPIEDDGGIQWEKAADAPLGLPEGWTMVEALKQLG